MHAFKDTEGREWSLTIKVGTLFRLREHFQLDFLTDERTLAGAIGRMRIELEVLFKVLFFLVKKQADDRQVSEVDFYDALAGEVIADATKAFIEELVYSFPPERRRPLAEAVGVMDEAMERATNKGIELMRSPEVMVQVERAVEEAGKAFLKRPVSSESGSGTFTS